MTIKTKTIKQTVPQEAWHDLVYGEQYRVLGCQGHFDAVFIGYNMHRINYKKMPLTIIRAVFSNKYALMVCRFDDNGTIVKTYNYRFFKNTFTRTVAPESSVMADWGTTRLFSKEDIAFNLTVNDKYVQHYVDSHGKDVLKGLTFKGYFYLDKTQLWASFMDIDGYLCPILVDTYTNSTILAA
jgi:hypothetical protein